jgi:hypothetical protein
MSRHSNLKRRFRILLAPESRRPGARHIRKERAMRIRSALVVVLVVQLLVPLCAHAASYAQVHTLKITALVTNVAGNPHEGDGEWGYSALVEVDGHKILYDTGASPDLVLRNMSCCRTITGIMYRG